MLTVFDASLLVEVAATLWAIFRPVWITGCNASTSKLENARYSYCLTSDPYLMTYLLAL